MTSIPARLIRRYQQAKDLYLDIRDDLRCIWFRCRKGGVLLMVIAFGVGLWL